MCLLFVIMWFFCLLTALPALTPAAQPSQNLTSPCTDKNHLFLAPGILSAGGMNRACISRFYPEGPARMVITLLADNGESTTAARDLPPGDGGCLDISVPLRPNTKADLVVNMRYSGAGCSWERRVPVRVASARVLALHTERARYRPGDTLRMRIIALKPDLTPAHENIDEVWLEGPEGAWEGTRVAQWEKIRTRLGLAQLQHQLDEHAPPGKWTVRARLGDGSQGSTAFWVGNYELPPFQLTVRHQAKVLRTSERLVWTVCVRYPWTEAVEGMLVIRLRGAGGDSSDGNAGVRTAVRLRAPRACHRHAAASWRVGLGGQHPPDVIVADFSFQEEGTRIWQNTTVVSQVVDSAFTLEFLTKHRAVLSPSLPYKLKVKATRWDEKPASGERVRVCRRAVVSPAVGPATGAGACVAARTDGRGVARVLFAAGDDGSAAYFFEAILHNATATLHLPVRRAASRAALGPLRADAHATRTLVPLYLNLSGLATPLTVHFVVITRGGIIYRWGATTQCPVATSTSQITPAPRNSTCNANLEKLLSTFEASLNNVDVDPNQLDVNASDSLLDRHLLRVMLPIRVTHQMCPDSHLLAYFYHNGELVSASKHFEMEECFGNKVEATWTSRQAAPGSPATLRLSTAGPALCALTALDTASTWVLPPPSVRDVILHSLRRLIDSRRNLTEYDAAGDCFMTSDSPDLPNSNVELTRAWLAAAGVRMLGEGTDSRRCAGSPPASLLIDKDRPPRSDFSEAWLWRLVPVGLNGSAATTARSPDSITRYEASAVCLSRSGVAISNPAVLQVFREVFVHADGPRALHRGDSAVVKYRIFNYLYEPLSIQIEVVADQRLGGARQAETACVAARGSVARRTEVRAAASGSARLSIRARSAAGDCGGTTKPDISDEVIMEVEVEPEGVPLQEYKSTMLCAAGESEPMPSNVSWTWSPVQTIPGTEVTTVWAVGDAIGPLLADADALVLLPRGCGEQNMARLATNLLALSVLDPLASAAAAARDHVARGFTRQLQYAHPAGGFSAFGAADPTPSTWLTAFCLRYMRRAHQVISGGLPAPPVLERAERWLLAQQMENGCFRNEGQVFHAELKGGLNEEGEIASVALTAYVITSLVESSTNIPLKVIRNSLSCLRALPPTKAKTHIGVYAHALLAYAFMRLRGYEEELRKTNEAYLREEVASGLKDEEELRELMLLLKLAKRSREYVYWESSSLSASIEATGYAARALARCAGALRAGCAADARAAARWLAAHRTPTGGFVSTQDTLVAMEALTAWSLLQPPAPSDLKVRAFSGSKTVTAALLPSSRVPDVMHVANGDQLTVSVEGSGCALVQATRSYRSAHAPAHESSAQSLRAQLAVRTDGAFDCAPNATACFCAAVIEACVVWSGAFPEMALLEVTLPGGYGADAALLYAQLQQQDTLLRRIELSPGGGKATLYLGTRGSNVGGAEDMRAHHRCWALHAVGPRARTAPAHLQLIDYYRPNIRDVLMYTIPEDCPSRTAHNTDEYLHHDNLYNKARSLDTGEIIITNEFSFEDIPEGTPLEDPIFENLTEKKDITDISKLNRHHDTKTHNSVDIPAERSELSLKERYDVGIDNSESKTRFVAEEENISTTENNFIFVNESFNGNRLVNVNGIHVQKTKLANEQFREPITTRSTDNQSDAAQTDLIEVNNPNLSDFHVIDSEKDLEVPSGVEGPVPFLILPPKDFVLSSTKNEESKIRWRKQPPSRGQGLEHGRIEFAQG